MRQVDRHVVVVLALVLGMVQRDVHEVQAVVFRHPLVRMLVAAPAFTRKVAGVVAFQRRQIGFVEQVGAFLKPFGILPAVFPDRPVVLHPPQAVLAFPDHGHGLLHDVHEAVGVVRVHVSGENRQVGDARMRRLGAAFADQKLLPVILPDGLIARVVVGVAHRQVLDVAGLVGT